MSSLAIVVPGHSRRGRVSARCLRLVETAAALADTHGPTVVVFTGRGEAQAMLDAWTGRRDVELVAEPTARITAHNAARSLPFLLERGVTRAIVVCGRAHAPRVRFFFRSLYARYGVVAEVRPAPSTFHPSAVVRELVAALFARRQRRAAAAELEAGSRG